MKKKIEAELIENFLVIWNPNEGTQLYKMGFYGKPVGIPKPKLIEFDVPLILDLMEGLYLVEKKVITVKQDKKKIGLKELLKRARVIHEDFDLKYTVYKDLRNHGLIVTPGIKFGCDFAVYKHGPGLEHAPFMVSVKKAKDKITATEIVKAGRLATTVRKRFIIASPHENKMQYFIFKWFKA
ncbi:MAG: tRNA-intron lyase [Candidatus Bathyarchaeales archaeon]